MRCIRTARLIPLAYLGLAVISLFNSGCLLAVAGVTAAGTATYFVYDDGELVHRYDADLTNVYSAVRISLVELSMPIDSEKTNGRTATFTSHTPDNDTITIQLDMRAPSNPKEAPVTRIGVRIGIWGDKGVSTRILDQVSSHLAYTMPTQGPIAGPVAPVPVSSAPPPSGLVPVSAPGGPPQSPPPPIGK